MRLTMITPMVVTSQDGTQRVNGNYGRLVDGLAKHFSFIHVLGAVPAWRDPTYYPDGTSFYRYSIISQNVNITPIPISLSTDNPWKKAVAWLRRLRPYRTAILATDVVYIAMPGFSSLMAYALCRVYRKPYILYYGSDWESQAAFMARWGTSRSPAFVLYRWLAAWAEGIPIRHCLFTLVTGLRLRERLSRYGPRVYETRPMLAIGPADFLDREDTCDGTPVRALYVGSLLPGKGVQYLIDAMAGLRDRQIAVTLTLVGAAEAEYVAKLKEQVTGLGLADVVTLAGFVNDIDALLGLYRQADLLVLPTLSEGFPRVLYEAMSQSLPIVATSIPPIAEALRADGEAVLVTPGSSSALADGIERVVRDGDLRRRLIAQGRAYAAARITAASTADQVALLTEEHLPGFRFREKLQQWARTYYSRSEAYQERLDSKWTDEWKAVFAGYVTPLVAGCTPGGLALDLGCGAGQTSSLIESAGLQVVGADIFLSALAGFPEARRTERIHLVNCDAAILPFANEAFRVVGSYAMLEHVTDAEKVLDEMLRVLRPGGRLVVSGPNMLSPFHAIRLWARGLRTGSSHPDGTIAAILSKSYWSFRKAISREYRFLYRQPHVEGLEFPGSDYDAVCLVNPFDLVRWSHSRKLEVSQVAEASSKAGKVVEVLAPYLAGGVCLVARKKA
jgi:glycosyltransferase involved in cell wall biosynthesis/ubiquinone/menaquinone biosynthesis C-methylase UbiE